MGKSIDAAKALLEKMTSNNYHWSSEKPPRREVMVSMNEVDAVTLLASRVDALMQSLNRVGASPA